MKFVAIAVLFFAGCASAPPGTSKIGPVAPGPAAALGASGCGISRVIDGDTIAVSCPGGAQRNVRLTGYDTPETYRPRCAFERARGKSATRRLRDLIAQAERFDLRQEGVDRYGRLLASLHLDGTDIARLMVAEGLAVRYDGGKRRDWCG